MNPSIQRSGSQEGRTGNILERLSLIHPSPNTNYISLAIGYGRQAVQPVVDKWTNWTPIQRVIAICIMLPSWAAPMMTFALMAPIIAILLIGGYVAVFGVETSTQHYDEAIREHFGTSSLTLESFKQRADELKQRAEGTGHVLAQRLLLLLSLSISQILVMILYVLDYIIVLLVKMSQIVTRQRQQVVGYKQKLENGERHHNSHTPNNDEKPAQKED